MVFLTRLRAFFRGAAFVALVSPCFAQQPVSAQAPVGQPAQPAGQNAGQPVQAGSAQPQQVAPQQGPPPPEPYILEDGGLSIEPIYWLNRAQPSLTGGAAATAYGNLSYPGNGKYGLGAQASMPAGRSNTLRISYFRVQGNANSTLTQDSTVLGEAFTAGDYINASYTIQSAKISWDYLGYTWNKRSGKIRLKELYEAQFVTISTTAVAPFAPVTTDSSGNTNNNIASGSKNIIFPTFGLELEEAIGHHFRWEVKGSGFGWPQHADIWDAEATLAFRFGPVEILGGEKAYHFKTSPQSDAYFTDTLSGAYVGVRYFWGRQE
jgi:hypothetical protein